MTGDIGEQAGDRLLGEIPDRLPHDVVFMSHHGQHGAKKTFYAAVKPEVAIATNRKPDHGPKDPVMIEREAKLDNERALISSVI